MKRIKKQVSFLLACLLIISGFLVGCKTEDTSAPSPEPTDSAPAKTEGEDKTEDTTQETPEEVDLSFPIVDEPITLSYFINMNSAMSATMPTYADVECFKEIEKLTNIKIDWIHPTGGGEQFALMIASDDLPDMINWPFGAAKGGAEALIRDSVLYTISDEELETYAPNYLDILEKNPSIKRDTILDDGTMYQFVNLNYDWETGEKVDFQIKGPYIRMDWVEAVGMEAPTTVDELYQVLTAFKEQDPSGTGDMIPMIDGKGMTTIKAMAGSFGVRWTMQSRDGKVAFGPTLPEFKTYLETMNKWYQEELINNDFPVREDASQKILSSEAGFTIASMGSGLTMQRESLMETHPGADLDSLPYLIGPDGYQCYVDDKGANPRATAITSSNEYPQETLRWIDYAYSPEGSLLTTFGIEGESYEMVDGKPVLTDKVMNPTSGWNQEEAIARYALGPINYPNARDIGFYEQVNLNTDQKVRIQTNWKTGTDDILLPPVILTTEESIEYGNLMADIGTYVDEMVLKFIIGQESMDKYDDFVAKVEKMDLDRAIEIQQNAVDRYNARD